MIFPANWPKHGKGAGFIRNQQMLNEGKPDLMIAFPGGKGTADMIEKAIKAGIKVIEV
jgi:predicted Rossmann-fold nucleotide-binding protein